MDKHLELEYKFNAKGVDPEKFERVLRDLVPDEVVYPTVRDIYYHDLTVDDDRPAVRYRIVEGKYQELTMKTRKSLNSLRERTEVNVKLDQDEDPEAVGKLLEMMGYERQFTLDKPMCSVYSFHEVDGEVEVALYSVRHVGHGDVARAFVEVEVKGGMTKDFAIDVLNEWKAFLQETFQLGKPLNQSLYEMYNQ